MIEHLFAIVCFSFLRSRARMMTLNELSVVRSELTPCKYAIVTKDNYHFAFHDQSLEQRDDDAVEVKILYAV